MGGGEVGKFFLDPLQMDVRADQWGSNCLSANTSCPGNQTISYGTYNLTYTPNYNFTDVTGTNLSRVVLNVTWNETSP